MFKFFKITCDEATTICDKSQYGEASIYERMQLSWHLVVCKICILYSKQNRKMSDILKLKSGNCKKNNPCFSQKEKEALKEYGSSSSGASIGDIIGAALKEDKKKDSEKTKDEKK